MPSGQRYAVALQYIKKNKENVRKKNIINDSVIYDTE